MKIKSIILGFLFVMPFASQAREPGLPEYPPDRYPLLSGYESRQAGEEVRYYCPCYNNSHFKDGWLEDYYPRLELLELYLPERLENMSADMILKMDSKAAALCKLHFKDREMFSDIYECDVLAEKVPSRKMEKKMKKQK